MASGVLNLLALLALSSTPAVAFHSPLLPSRSSRLLAEDSLGDWRAFRKKLAEGESPATRPKSVSKGNEELLLEQNEELAREYLNDAWAHDTPKVETGGLMLRLPIEMEAFRGNSALGRRVRGELDAGAAAETARWYRDARSIVGREIGKVAAAAEDGKIDPGKLSADSEEVLRAYLDVQETWQEVCLVLEDCAVVINRPMALRLTDDLSRFVLFGNGSGREEELERFHRAFSEECYVYVGGPDDVGDHPALLVHGIADLEGAKEISPGSKIYRGGLRAAVEGVLRGDYAPLDFRFFVGRHRCSLGELDRKVSLGKYQPVACARSVALKQCISLPKPLWNEVMELCGGELKEVSSLELLNRDDLQMEDTNDDEF